MRTPLRLYCIEALANRAAAGCAFASFEDIRLIDKETLRDRFRARAQQYLPANARKYSLQLTTLQPGTVAEVIGLRIDVRPFEGKLIDRWEDDTLVVRIGRQKFAAVAGDAIALHDAAIGDEVRVMPYARRRFDGGRCDEGTDRSTPDSAPYRVLTFLLGGHDAKLPVRATTSRYLADLLEQCQMLPASDGFRFLEHVLVDANATDVRVVDPSDAAVFDTPPALECEVQTTKFHGTLAIVYDRGLDYYRIELRREGKVVKQVAEVAFCELPATLEALIDDGQWRFARLEVLQRRAVAKQAA